ncbi:ribokinase [Lysobacter helvus]|uniref:Ribokinase n=2 Tax=Lysobacteraceae TaxID=32033 RepID=A0ABN6FUY9_9GAMM|nr:MULTISPECIES: ribokinase [Lysobacter]BCT92759.1 ribokinase [Lysobacter caseinilyticus]BCT95912.1 ribokinase [Lysobacter helvus]
MTRVVVAGSFNVDHVWRCESLPHPGETLAGAYGSGPGGKGFNQAVAAVRAGAATTFLCALGDDAGAQLARALANADGIDLRDQRSTHPTGTAGIYVDAQGRNSIVIGAGANGDLDAGFIAAQVDVFTGARVVLVQRESPTDAVAMALRLGREAGATTVLNPAPANADVDGTLLALTDIATPNETEFVALAGKHVGERIDPESVVRMDDDALHAVCRRLLPHGTVVITLGAAGAFVSHGDAMRGDRAACYRVAAERADVVDTTGAGDAFSGALAASIAQRDAAFAEHVAFAGLFAARSTERRGAAEAMPRLRPA